MFGVPLVIAYLGLRQIKYLIWINLILSVSLVIVSGIFAYEMGLTQIIVMPLMLYSFILAVINFTAIFVFWGKHHYKAFIPIGISVITFALVVCSMRIGNQVNSYVFNKRIALYEDAVQMIDGRSTNGSPIRLLGNEIPEKYRCLAYFIYGEKENNILRVDFCWGGGFPCKHVAYVYLSNDEVPQKGSNFRKDWYRCYRIRKNWFRASD